MRTDCPYLEGSRLYCSYGAATLAEVLGRLEQNSEAVKGATDAETVHQIRVACRRVRTTLRLFAGCFPEKKIRRWNRGIKRAATALGAARDLDVHIAHLEEYQKRIGRGNYAVHELHKTLVAQRRKTEKEVCASLKDLKRRSIIEEIRSACASIPETTPAVSSGKNAALLYSHTQISIRIDDLLMLEGCVWNEKDTAGHHRMRIAVKRLRYTIEAYSGLYGGVLDSYVAPMKRLQEVLGDMHDCDVWLESLPTYFADMSYRIALQDPSFFPDPEDDNVLLRIPRKVFTYLMSEVRRRRAEKDAVRFLRDIRSMRRTLYREFVSEWQSLVAKKFFPRLRKASGTESMPPETGRPKIAILSDVHGNADALKAVMEDAKKRGADYFLNAGDTVGPPYVDETINLLRSPVVQSVTGDFDMKVAGAGCSREGDANKDVILEYTRSQTNASARRFICSLPKILRLDVGGKNIVVIHGSPESIGEQARLETTDSRMKELASTLCADVIVMGHSHTQYSKETNGVLFVNPGSVGRPADKDPRAAYAMMSFNPFKIELLRVPYDIEEAAEAIRKSRLPESLALNVIHGTSHDSAEGAQKEKRSYADHDAVLKELEGTVSRYGVDAKHAAQVRSIAVKLFRGLKEIHGLGKEEEYLLECAALLHDLGWSRGQKEHHKNSLRLILNDVGIPLTTWERYIVGSIARYHRKRHPKKTDYNLARLSERDLRTVFMLSSILRLADGLDYSHRSIVKDVKVSPKEEVITIECTFSGDKEMEDQSAGKKKDLLEKTFGKKAEIQWKQKVA